MPYCVSGCVIPCPWHFLLGVCTPPGLYGAWRHVKAEAVLIVYEAPNEKRDSQLWEDSARELHANKLRNLQWMLSYHGYKQANCLAIPYKYSVRQWFFCQCSRLLHKLFILAAWCSPSKYVAWTLCYIVRYNQNFNLKTQQLYHLLILWRALKSSILFSTTDKDHSSRQEPRHWYLV